MQAQGGQCLTSTEEGLAREEVWVSSLSRATMRSMVCLGVNLHGAVVV